MSSSYKANYKVFRNVVTDFGADNTGANDASAAIQEAINGELSTSFVFSFSSPLYRGASVVKVMR